MSWVKVLVFLAVMAWQRATLGEAPGTSTLLSPPLQIAAGRCVDLRIPREWYVSSHDPEDAWQTSSYAFTIRERNTSDQARHAPVLRAEFLFLAYRRAERQGRLSGTKIKTRNGLGGVFEESSLSVSEDGPQHCWRVAVPIHHRRAAIILEICSSEADSQRVSAIVRSLLRSLRVR